MITRLIFVMAFLLGTSAIIAMGVNFIESNTLALIVTGVIGAVYTIGFLELIQFRRATITLTGALSSLSQDASEQLKSLDEWLITLHPSLQNSVRQRIEGERIALPAPVLTPYLVGLLVMLGLLGTFVGLVETLKGVVVALEGTAELDAIRQALTAPMGGLGLAFGTSVAGVAASAMLGLMSTLSKRDRLLSSRLLNDHIRTSFQRFSKFNQQQASLQALERQSQDLPVIADKLGSLIEQMTLMSDKLGVQLTDNQIRFHESSRSLFEELATSVDKSLRESIEKSERVLGDSGRLVAEGMQPVMLDTMSSISDTLSQNVQATQKTLSHSVQDHLQSLSGQFTRTSEAVALAWKNGIAAHEHSNEVLIQDMKDAFTDFKEEFGRTSSNMLDAFNQTVTQWFEHHSSSENKRLEHWTEALQKQHQESSSNWQSTSQAIIDELNSVAGVHKTSMHTITDDMTALSSELMSQMKQSSTQSMIQQQQITSNLDETARSVIASTKDSHIEILSEIKRLVNSSETLVETRVANESKWLESYEQRMQQLTTSIQSELKTLRDDEMERGQLAVERMAQLESVVANHLTSLGNALEAPMTQLIEIASETPRAAAEVIGQLRQEISNNIERDNKLLEERTQLLSKLDAASETYIQTSADQRDAIEKLVEFSAQRLNGISEQFSSNVVNEIDKVSELTDHFSVSAAEIASLGEAFTLAVGLFNESNSKLIDSLGQIEHSLKDSNTRSNEQLGYYVAQAREVIDYSVLSQKEIFDELRQLSLNSTKIQRETLQETAEVN